MDGGACAPTREQNCAIIHINGADILSSIRQSERREIKCTGVGVELCLSAIVLCPLDDYKWFIIPCMTFISSETAGEGVALSRYCLNSMVINVHREYRRDCHRGNEINHIKLKAYSHQCKHRVFGR